MAMTVLPRVDETPEVATRASKGTRLARGGVGPSDRALAPAAAGREVEQPVQILAQRRAVDPGLREPRPRTRVVEHGRDREVREVDADRLDRGVRELAHAGGELRRWNGLRLGLAEVSGGQRDQLGKGRGILAG